MSASAVMQLRGESSWEPGRLLATDFRWPGAYITAQIGDVTTALAPSQPIERGTPVIAPRDVDPQSGGLRDRTFTYSGVGYQVQSAGNADSPHLQPGDVLIPPRADQPALFITQDLVGSVVAGSFSALRVPVGGPWLWAVLNSEAGVRLRRLLALGGVTRSGLAGSLQEVAIPWFPARDAEVVQSFLRPVAEQISKLSEEARGSWWRVADLRQLDWRIALATPRPEIVLDGIPLTELATLIRTGRVERRLVRDEPEPGDLVVANIQVLRGREPQMWIAPDVAPVIAHPGDLLVAAVGDWSYAFITHDVCAVGTNVHLVRLDTPSLAPSIASYMNGRTGIAVRRAFLTGMGVPMLRALDLRQFPIPPRALDADVPNPDPRPLTTRLEEALWH